MTLPPFLIADTPGHRSFIVLPGPAGVLIAEIFNDDDTAPVDGLTIVMPRGNGVLANLTAYGDPPHPTGTVDECNQLGGLAALALEEEEFRREAGE